MITVTSVEAQNSFGKLLDSAQREPVVVTRHGHPAAFIVSPHHMNELIDRRRRRSNAISDLEAWGRRAAQSASPETANLTEQEIVRLVKESR